MTAPPCDVILTLPSGGEHAICNEETINDHSQRSWSTYDGTAAMLAAVQCVQRAFPGAAVTSPAQAHDDCSAAARARGLEYDAERGAWDCADNVRRRVRGVDR